MACCTRLQPKETLQAFSEGISTPSPRCNVIYLSYCFMILQLNCKILWMGGSSLPPLDNIRDTISDICTHYLEIKKPKSTGTWGQQNTRSCWDND
jgi:hypothetical protein